MEKQIQINLPPLKDLKAIKCETCENDCFFPVHNIKIVPALLVGTPQDSHAIITRYKCDSCGALLEMELT